MTTQTLSLRETRKFVGTYQGLDRWNDIGTAKVLASTIQDLNAAASQAAFEEGGDEASIAVEYDPCEPHLQTMLLCVACDEPQPVRRIEDAIRDSFSSVGCAHEYDCCGCRSFHVTKAEHLAGDRWEVNISSSRNY